jgi:hypothetical protein
VPTPPQMLPLSRPLSAATQPLVIITSATPTVDLAPSPQQEATAQLGLRPPAVASAQPQPHVSAAYGDDRRQADAAGADGEPEIERCPSPLPVNLEELDSPGDDLEGMMSGDLGWVADPTPPEPEQSPARQPAGAGIGIGPASQRQPEPAAEGAQGVSTEQEEEGRVGPPGQGPPAGQQEPVAHEGISRGGAAESKSREGEHEDPAAVLQGPSQLTESARTEEPKEAAAFDPATLGPAGAPQAQTNAINSEGLQQGSGAEAEGS